MHQTLATVVYLREDCVCVCVRAGIQTEDLSVVKHQRSEDFWQSEDGSLRFFTRLTLEGTRPHITHIQPHPRVECAEQKFVCDFLFYF